MSKSLKRVRAALLSAGLPDTIRETARARTAQEAADAIGCAVDQIAKSIIFADAAGEVVLFITAGGQSVNPDQAGQLARSALSKASAELIRARTGFAIGGVSPIGHLHPPRAFFDPKLLEFEVVWAAAGTPHHVFSCAPATLQKVCGATRAGFTDSL